METILERCVGLDVHRDSVVACIRMPGPRKSRTQEIKKFGTTTDELLALRDWLEAHSVTHAAMESTGVYWKPVYYVLEDRFTVLLVNAAHMRNVPGKKTDVMDCAWIAQLLEHGLLRGSFVPPAPIRELRDLTRYRKTLIEERTSEINRLQKHLEDAGVKLASVASNVMGVSARAMLEGLVRGTKDPAVLADLAKGQLRKKIPELQKALAGRFREHHAFLVSQILAHVDYLDESIEVLSKRTEEAMRPFTEAAGHLDTIPGVNQRTAEVIVAEIGVDMAKFPDAGQLASWAGICPGNNVSAGKNKGGKTRKGDSWLCSALVQASLAAINKKECALAARYRRIMRHAGHKVAVVAVAHSMLIAIYHILLEGKPYHELGAAYLERRDNELATRKYVRMLERLGHKVILAPAPA